jgi:hypothetical protein
MEGGLVQLQRLATLGQVGVGLVYHHLLALKGLPLPLEPVLEGEELLLSEAQLPLAVASLRFSHDEPSLLQAQALCVGVGALLASMKKGLAVLSFLQPLPGIGQEAVGVGPGLVQEMLCCLFCLFPSQGWVGRPDGGRDPLAHCGGDLRGLVVPLAKISLADALAPARTSSASSAALAQISSAAFLTCSWCSAARRSRRRHLSVAWWRRAQPLSRCACSAARALVTSL